MFNICDALGIAPDDPRGLTLTGGLPFFGGAGNNYSMHAIAEIVTRVRQSPGDYGVVVANGGILSKHAVGVYSTTPTGWRHDDSADIQKRLDARPAVRRRDDADGDAIIETFTVMPHKDGRRTGIVIGRLVDATGAVVELLRAAGWPGPGPDRYLAPEIETAVDLIGSGRVLEVVEDVTGPLA